MVAELAILLSLTAPAPAGACQSIRVDATMNIICPGPRHHRRHRRPPRRSRLQANRPLLHTARR